MFSIHNDLATNGLAKANQNYIVHVFAEYREKDRIGERYRLRDTGDAM